MGKTLNTSAGFNGPPMTAASGKAHRTLTAAQRARREKRKALGITDIRKATWGDELLARASKALPTHADAVANKVAAQKADKKGARNVPVLGTAAAGGLRPAQRKRKKGGPAGGKPNSVTGRSMSSSGVASY